VLHLQQDDAAQRFEPYAVICHLRQLGFCANSIRLTSLIITVAASSGLLFAVQLALRSVFGMQSERILITTIANHRRAKTNRARASFIICNI
jgi:hypothetical protein